MTAKPIGERVSGVPKNAAIRFDKVSKEGFKGIIARLRKKFADVEDRSVQRRCTYATWEIIPADVLATMCGAQSYCAK